MKYDLGRDLEEVDNFFILRSERHDSFLSKLTFEIKSNLYVRVLKEAIDRKGRTFPGYDIYTDIFEMFNSDTGERKYGLEVTFDKL